MQLPRRPWPWIVSFACWLVILCLLSSRPSVHTPGFGLPHVDKVLHFGWFFGGAGLFSAAIYGRTTGPFRWKHVLWVTATIALIGWADEIHQTYTEGRDGKSLGDWVADAVGGFVGALVFRRVQPKIFRDHHTNHG